MIVENRWALFKISALPMKHSYSQDKINVLTLNKHLRDVDISLMKYTTRI